MDLIRLRGSNCYLNCVVSAAAFLGLRYENSFATLWSETDFDYDCRHESYSTRRMPNGLEVMGMRLIAPACGSPSEVAAALAPRPDGDLVLVAMDAFYVPWSPLYRALHDHHYFLARKTGPDSFLCFDPTYDRRREPLSGGDIAANAYDLRLIEGTPQTPLRTGVGAEALEVARRHPRTEETLLFEISACAGEKRTRAAPLAKYIAALIQNRYLFQHYLETAHGGPGQAPVWFGQDFFSRWEAVKNGLYKASLIEHNTGVLRDVGNVFTLLMEEEVGLAKQILNSPAGR